jgi:hypothetical protein
MLERIQIVRDLRRGEFDVLVGINLLREGLDIPEVSLVGILDADKEDFLRSVGELQRAPRSRERPEPWTLHGDVSRGNRPATCCGSTPVTRRHIGVIYEGYGNRPGGMAVRSVRIAVAQPLVNEMSSR